MMPANSFLPEHFEPSITEVIVGRGKRAAEHSGTKRFQKIVRAHVREYSAAPTKREKSELLTRIVNSVRNDSIYQAGFVKQDGHTGRWRIVEDSAARIMTAQAFRDALHINYKSSKQFKQQRRQDEREVIAKGKPARVVQQTVCPQEASSPLPTSTISEGSLSSLWTVLESCIQVDPSENPFEPTPLPENHCSVGSVRETQVHQLIMKSQDVQANSAPSSCCIGSDSTLGKLHHHEGRNFNLLRDIYLGGGLAV